MHGQCQGLLMLCVPLQEAKSRDFRGPRLVQIARDFLHFFAGQRDVSKAEVTAAIRPLSELLFGKTVCI